MMWGVRIAAVVTATVALVAGCSSPSGDEPRPNAPTPSATTAAPSPSTPAIGSYVAIGDSFTSGPGLARLRPDSGFCFRSARNWPSILASRLGVPDVVDESCAGAVADDVLAGRALPGGDVEAQIDAVKRDTELVTVGIGGNDGGLFASLVSACTRQAGACRGFVEDTVPAVLQQTVPGVVRVLDAVRDRAPDATVLLVGYLRIMPDAGTCAAVPVPAADAAEGSRAEEALDAALASAARQAGIDYVSMRAASRGHDACAGRRAWTNGATPTGSTGIAFHPRPAGMRAVADAVAERLTGR